MSDGEIVSNGCGHWKPGAWIKQNFPSTLNGTQFSQGGIGQRGGVHGGRGWVVESVQRPTAIGATLKSSFVHRAPWIRPEKEPGRPANEPFSFAGQPRMSSHPRLLALRKGADEQSSMVVGFAERCRRPVIHEVLHCQMTLPTAHP
jgi:hypothetical protein